MKILKLITALLLLFSLMATSCSTSRKCDGRKATKTPMGNL